MRLLILGGSGFVGRAVAAEAVRRGDEVTVFNRGRRDLPAGVRAIRGDRADPVLDGEWDAVVDTWSGDGSAVRRSAELLRGRAGHYTYVSTVSVYRMDSPAGMAEDVPLTDPDGPGYAADKVSGERATAAFGGPVLLVRPGLILGPYEDIGRLPWWLNRLARGGPTLAPGPAELGVRFVDARDLASFILDNVGTVGPFNVVGPPGHTTMGELLGVANEVTGGRAELRWTDPGTIAAAGVEPWTELPIWLPPGEVYDFMNGCDVSRAVAAGLRCRPVRETVADTWEWLRAVGAAPLRADRPRPGLDPAKEAAVLGGQ